MLRSSRSAKKDNYASAEAEQRRDVWILAKVSADLRRRSREAVVNSKRAVKRGHEASRKATEARACARLQRENAAQGEEPVIQTRFRASSSRVKEVTGAVLLLRAALRAVQNPC